MSACVIWLLGKLTQGYTSEYLGRAEKGRNKTPKMFKEDPKMSKEPQNVERRPPKLNVF